MSLLLLLVLLSLHPIALHPFAMAAPSEAAMQDRRASRLVRTSALARVKRIEVFRVQSPPTRFPEEQEEAEKKSE